MGSATTRVAFHGWRLGRNAYIFLVSILRHPPQSVPPIVTGEDLARAAAADFEHFFLPGGEVPIRVEVKGVNAAITRGVGEKTRIVIPREMATEVVDSADKLHFHLLILGHEIAHVVHRHNDEVDQAPLDYHALEMWADFYGAKVMMCLLTFGSQVNPKFREFYPGDYFLEDALESMGRAVERLVTGVYTNHPRYPFPLLRVGLVNNGIMSFLRRELKGAPGIWPYSVFKRVFASPAVRELMKLHPEHIDPNFEPIERARRWHLAVQGDQMAIAPWLHPRLVHHLHTSFQQTDAEREASRAERARELQDAGLLPADNDATGSSVDQRSTETEAPPFRSAASGSSG
nr:hypothetical protein GCM10017606_29740 [Microbacterium terregens]